MPGFNQEGGCGRLFCIVVFRADDFCCAPGLLLEKPGLLLTPKWMRD